MTDEELLSAWRLSCENRSRYGTRVNVNLWFDLCDRGLSVEAQQISDEERAAEKRRQAENMARVEELKRR